MQQSQEPSPTETSAEQPIDVDESLSSESKKQGDTAGRTGVYSRKTPESNLVFLEGAIPEGAPDEMRDDSIESQAEGCFDQLESMLAERDLTLADVMKVEIHLTDPGGAPVVDEIYESRFGDAPLPPRTVVGVCSLPGGANIQLDVVAVEE